MEDLIGKIVAAIIRQEGAPADAKNPGNLRGAPWEPNPVVSPNHYWQPSSRAEGVAGIFHVIALHVAKGQSLSQVIYSWAPPSDSNPTARYIANVKLWAGIPDEHAALWLYLEPSAPTPVA